MSAESWYEGPEWTKRAIRTIPVKNGYVDSFSDLPLDVDQDGFTDVIQIGYFARRIVWMKNPGKADGEWTEHLIDDGDMDVVSAGKSGLFLAENLTRSATPAAK